MSDDEKRDDKNSEAKGGDKQSYSIWQFITWDRFINLMVAVGTISLAVYTYRLWDETHNLVIEAEKTSTQQAADTQASLALTKQVATAAIESVDAAKIQASASAKSAQISERAFVAAQRAWVGPSGVKIDGPIEAGKDISITFNVFNSGREPAKNFTSTITTFAATDEVQWRGELKRYVESSVENCLKTKSQRRSQVIYPTAGFGAGGFTYTEKIPKEWIDADFISGRKTLGVQGCLTYETFGKTRHSVFCYFYRHGKTSPDNLAYCSNGTDAD